MKNLLKLRQKAIGDESQALVVKSLRDTMDFPGVIEKWLKDQRTVLDKMRLLTAIHLRIKTIPVSCAEKDEALTTIDDFCFDLMTEAKLLDAVENQGNTMVEKADKLLLLAQSGSFPDGRTLDALRKRVLFHTQPQGFIKAYTADSKTPDEATHKLAEFKTLLQEAGIV